MLNSIILDCDEVLLSWFNGFRNFLSKEKDVHPVVKHSKPDTFCMSNWLGMDRKEIFEYIEEFNEYSEQFEDLKPSPGATSFLMLVRSRYPEKEIYVVTSCSNSPKTVERRKRNLNKVFGEDVFSDIICLDMKKNVQKKDILKDFEPSIWVEDNFYNALQGVQCGHKTYLIEKSYNKDFEQNCGKNNIKMVQNIIDVYDDMVYCDDKLEVA